MTGAARLRIFAAGLLLAGLPGVQLVEAGYSALSPEVIGLTVGFGLVGAGIGWALRRSAGYKLAFLAMLLCFVDVYFVSQAIIDRAAAIQPLLGAVVGLAPYLAILGLLLAWRRVESSLLLIAPVFALVFGLGAALTPRAPMLTPLAEGAKAPGNPSLGTFVHVILDEQKSPLFDDPAGAHPGKALLDQYAAAGFRAHGRVMSIADQTTESLGNLFADTAPEHAFIHRGRGEHYTNAISTNRSAERLQAAGFRVSVIQSSYIDLCIGTPGVACDQYTRAQDMGALDRAGLSLPRRFGLALLALHQGWRHEGGGRDMQLWRMTVVRAWDALKGPRASDLDYFSRPALVLDVIDEMGVRVAAMRAGDALIVHLLMPHYPYVLDQDCALKPLQGWAYPHSALGAKSRSEIYGAYWDQSACTNDRLLAALAPALARPDATVMLHGDHGARILHDTPDRTLEDSRGTLFALHARGVAPVVDTVQAMLPDLYSAALDKVVSKQVSEALDAPRAGR